MEETDPASLTQLPSSWAQLSSCTKKLVCLSRTQALYITVGLGLLPCLLCAIIEIFKLPSGVRCLGYVFFLNTWQQRDHLQDTNASFAVKPI